MLPKAFPISRILVLVVGLGLAGRGNSVPAAAAAAVAAGPESPAHGGLARRILADQEMVDVLKRARELLGTGLTAGEGYGEVWIRDLNTFIELYLATMDPRPVRESLLLFLKFQGAGGDIVDGYIPESKATVGYQYRKSGMAPGLLAHKNTVETDQESSLVQAVARYVRITRDESILREVVGGKTVLERLRWALEYLTRERFDARHGLLWGATTVDWGDVQPEHEWGVELDAGSHRAIDIYDNAMFLVALRDLDRLDARPGKSELRVGDGDGDGAGAGAVERVVREGVRKHLWDAGRGKFIPHVYLDGSPFPADFDEASVWYHGGTAVAMEAGLLEPAEVRATLAAMRENVRKAGAASIGLTVYPPYPDGLFKNPGMKAWSYQNGGDWCWFGGRLVQQLIAQGMVEEAYIELQPMIRRVIRHGGFHEWWTRDNQPRGSGKYRGSAGVLGRSIVLLREWAEGETAREAR